MRGRLVKLDCDRLIIFHVKFNMRERFVKIESKKMLSNKCTSNHFFLKKY